MIDHAITERPPVLVRQPAILMLTLLLATAAFGGEPRLETHFGITACGDDDLSDTYGVLPVVDLGLSFRIAPTTRFLVAAGFGQKHGNPYTDDETFQSDDTNRLRVVPVTIGLRFDLATEGRTTVVGGLCLQPTWMQERYPGEESDFAMVSHDAFGVGFLLTLGPEWRLGDSRRILRLEFCVGGAISDINEDAADYEIDTRGFQVRLGLGLPLGSAEVSS